MTILTITCPRCSKKFKGKPDLYGKRVRCPGCAGAFVVPSPDQKIDEKQLKNVIDVKDFEMSAEADPRTAIQAAGPRRLFDDDEGPAQYIVTEEEDIPRCPHCANPLESADSIVCLYCGYNTATRTWGKIKKSVETTSRDRVLWLLPGFICLAVILLQMIACLYYCIVLPATLGLGWQWLGSEAVKIWMVFINLAIMWPLGFFAYLRLVLHPTPPDKEAD
jgi:hypothetical protein